MSKWSKLSASKPKDGDEVLVRTKSKTEYSAVYIDDQFFEGAWMVNVTGRMRREPGKIIEWKPINKYAR